MNIRRALTAIGAFGLLALSAASANAQTVTCSPIASGTVWPNGDFSKTCGSASDSGQMLSTLQAIADRPTDAAARLKGYTVTAGDELSIQIQNDNINDDDANHTVTVSYEVQTGDNLVKVARALAAAINNDSDLIDAGFFANSSGTSVQIFSPFTGNSQYSATTSAGATETISVDSNGYVVLGGTTSQGFVKFYAFSNKSEYDTSTAEPLDINGNHDTAIRGDVNGVTPTDGDTNPYGWSVVYNSATPGSPHYNTPNITAHELGHHLDYIYGAEIMPNKATHIHVVNAPGHTPAVGDGIRLRVNNPLLPGGIVNVDVEADVAGEPIASLLLKLRNAINNDSDLTSNGFSASNDDRSVVVFAENNSPTTYAVEFTLGSHFQHDINSDRFATRSAKWRAALDADWQIANANPVCGYYASSVPGDYHPGLMSNRKDPAGNYICNDLTDPNVTSVPSPGGGTSPTGAYAGMNNRQIMETAWPEIFSPSDPVKQLEEIFAEQVAVFFVFTDWKFKSGPNSGQLSPIHHDRNFQWVDHIWFAEQFPCTNILVFNLLTDGEATIPSGFGGPAGQYPNRYDIACPAF